MVQDFRVRAVFDLDADVVRLNIAKNLAHQAHVAFHFSTVLLATHIDSRQAEKVAERYKIPRAFTLIPFKIIFNSSGLGEDSKAA